MINPQKINSLSLTIGSILTHTMLVNGGVRSVASVMVRNEHLDECKDLIKKEGLLSLLNPRGESYSTIYIFRHPYLENVINFDLGNPHDSKVLSHWINGKMFGYSDEEIAKFIKENS